jgi:hypothetical protein
LEFAVRNPRAVRRQAGRAEVRRALTTARLGHDATPKEDRSEALADATAAVPDSGTRGRFRGDARWSQNRTQRASKLVPGGDI